MARRFDLRHLDAFLAVCESLHFGQAADRLCLSQPALTRTIQQLETALGVALFERDKRNVALTDVGMTLRDHARKLVEQARAAETDVQRKADGRVGR
jgi:DNA-binding transcriptional LysR family regulator